MFWKNDVTKDEKRWKIKEKKQKTNRITLFFCDELF